MSLGGMLQVTDRHIDILTHSDKLLKEETYITKGEVGKTVSLFQ